MRNLLAIVALVAALFLVIPHAYAADGEREDGRVSDELIAR